MIETYLYAFVSVLVVSLISLVGVFTFLFLRELRIGPKGSFFGALLFSFSSYMTVWMEYGNIGHSILWLPLLMFLSLRFIRKPSFKTSLFMIGGLTFSLLAGYIQTSFYVFSFLLLFMIFNIFSLERGKRFSLFLKILPVFLVPVLLSSVQLLPTFELLSDSTRASYSVDNLGIIGKFFRI